MTRTRSGYSLIRDHKHRFERKRFLVWKVFVKKTDQKIRGESVMEPEHRKANSRCFNFITGPLRTLMFLYSSDPIVSVRV
jgi:hypothetical protein